MNDGPWYKLTFMNSGIIDEQEFSNASEITKWETPNCTCVQPDA